MKYDNKYKIALAINLIIVILVVLSLFLLYFGISFMEGPDISKGIEGNEIFHYFTIDSNIFMAIMSLIFAIDEIKIIQGKIKQINYKKYIAKLISTATVALTFLTVLLYLGPTTEGGLKANLMNGNLFLHLFVPILSVIVFIFFEKTDKIPFKYTFLGLTPMMIYGLYYIPNLIIHSNNGKVVSTYDFYHYFQNGPVIAIITGIIQYIVLYGLTYLLWKLNKKKKLNI